MTILNIGNDAYNSADVAEKVQSDINFLLARIEHLRAQPSPNPVVLQTYREMLDSRQAVLDWLIQGQTNVHAIAHNLR